MKYNTRPTKKIKDVARKVLKEGKSVSQAMRESGYSKATSKNPKNVTERKGWLDLMDEYLPEEELAQLHREQLRATKPKPFGGEVPDNDARLKALDMGYKLRGNYKPTQLDVRSFVGWTPTELEAYAKDGTIPERFRIEG